MTYRLWSSAGQPLPIPIQVYIVMIIQTRIIICIKKYKNDKSQWFALVTTV